MMFPGDLLEHARGLVAVAGELSRPGPAAFERAAGRLGIDPSVLRRRVQALDTWVGGPLLEGRGARLRLSARGAETVARCERLLEVAAALRTPGVVRLSIGCTGTIVTELLPSVLVELERTQPAIRVAVRRLGSAACVRLLESGEVDLGVVRGVAPPPGFSAERLCDDRLWLAAPRGHRLLRERPLRLEAIAREPLVLYGEASQTRARVLDRLGPLGAQVRVEVDGKASALEYVARGLGLSFLSLLPRHEVKRSGVGLREVTELFQRASFWVLRARGAPPVAEQVARLMRRLA